jgi:hypothetical protein
MQYISRLAVCLVLLSCCASASAADIAPLSVSIKCSANPKCVFTGQDIELAITIQNRSEVDVGLNLDYIRRAGPYVELKDTKSGERMNLHVSLVSNELLKDFYTLSPKQSVILKEKIAAYEITSFREKSVDLTIKVGLPGNFRVGNAEPESFDEIGLVRIVDKSGLRKMKAKPKKTKFPRP